MTPGAVAVVIPARDEEDQLPACLDELAELDGLGA